MKILGVALLGVLAMGHAKSNDLDLVLEGCNALPSPKRVKCISAGARLAAASSNKDSKPKKPSAQDELISSAQSRIMSMLKDPESARFGGVAISQQTGAVCGTVNSKNSYGGYAGPARYIVTQDAAYLETSEKWKIESRWYEHCPDI